jgi:hypothetical protein
MPPPTYSTGRSAAMMSSGRFLDHARVPLGGGAVAGQRRGDLVVARPVPRHLVLQDVLGQVDQRRAGAAGRGDVERLADRHRDVLGDMTSSLCLVQERVMPTVSHSWNASVPIAAVADLAGDADHRDRVHVGVHERRDQVGRRRAGGDHRDAGRPVTWAYPSAM